MNRLWMTVGLPRSGKSTTAQGMGFPIVNPDAIRLALHGQAFIGDAEPMVWAMAKYMARALFLAGHEDVILDATNTTAERRKEWIDKRWKREFVIVDTSKDVCISRVNQSNDYLIPVIEKMAAQYESVTIDEMKDWER